MLQIRPISDLRNNFSEIESTVQRGSPVCLTKNGYGSVVLMSIAQYERLTDPVEAALDEADRQAEETDLRLTHEEVFTRIRERK